MGKAALGSTTLLGLAIDRPSDLYNVGHPGLDSVVVAAPASAISSADGGTGLLTGGLYWRSTYLVRGKGETSASASSTVLSITLKDADLTAIPVSGASNVYARRLYRSSVAEPTACTDGLAGAGAGLLANGNYLYKIAYVVNGIEGVLGAVSGGVTVADYTSDGKVALSAIPTGPTGTTARKIYRTKVGGTVYYYVATLNDNSTSTYTDNTADASLTVLSPNVGHYYHVATLWDNTTAIYTDNLVMPSTEQPPALNETGANNGLAFARLNSVTLEANYASIDTPELTGKSAIARKVPGAVQVQGNVVGAFRVGSAVPFICAAYGKPTVTLMADGATWEYVWKPSVSQALPLSLTAFLQKGGNLTPEFLYGNFVSQIALKMAAGQLVDDTMTMLGVHHSLCAPATYVASTGTYTGKLVTRGVRFDAYAATDPIYVKITTAPSAGTFGIKVKTSTAATYDGAEIFVAYKTATTKQTKGGTQVSDWVELFDENDDAIGADVGVNRMPFQALWTGVVTTLGVNDEFTIPYAAVNVGTATGASGYPARTLITSRFVGAHAFVKKDGSVIEATEADLNLMTPRIRYTPLGPEGRFTLDIEDNGYYAATCQIKRRYDSREWETQLQTDDRVTLDIVLQGAPIVLQPDGSHSTYRESITFAFPQAAITNTGTPVSGPGWVVETIDLAAEQPDDEAKEFVTITAYSSESWQSLA